jgi:hypothetical protein
MTCFFCTGDWLDSSKAECGYVSPTNYVVAILPYWFRFLQCLKRYKDTEAAPHLINAGKYSMSILMNIANIFHSNNNLALTIYIAIGVISTFYSYSWDLYMDWGCVRSFEKETYLLRSKILYPKWFYYYSMVTNFILRFFWTLSLIPSSCFPPWFNNANMMFLI